MGKKHPWNLGIIVFLLIVACGCSTASPKASEAETTVRGALERIAAGDNASLTSLLLPEDAQLIDAANRSGGAGDKLFSRLTAALIVVYGPEGIPKLIVTYTGETAGYSEVDVGPSESAPMLPVFISTEDGKVDLLASFAAYVAPDLLQLAENDPDVRALLAARLSALTVADEYGLLNLRPQPGTLQRLIRLLQG